MARPTFGIGPGRKSDKPWRDALRIAVMRPVPNDPEGRKFLMVAAEQVAIAAATGDLEACAEIGNRLDGRPQQAIDVTHKGGPFDGWDAEQLQRLAETLDGLLASGTAGDKANAPGPTQPDAPEPLSAVH